MREVLNSRLGEGQKERTPSKRGFRKMSSSEIRLGAEVRPDGFGCRGAHRVQGLE